MTENKPARQLYDVNVLKARNALPDVMKAAGIDLRRKGREFVGLCPFHGDRNPSMTVFQKSGEWFFKCHPCGAGGDVVNFVEDYFRLSTFDAFKYLAGDSGSVSDGQARQSEGSAELKARKLARDQEDAQRAKRKRDWARELWDSAKQPDIIPVAPDPLHVYFSARGIDFMMHGCRPPALRFLPKLEYVDTDSGEVLGEFPAMLGAVCNARREIIAVHRTYLKADFSGKADVPKAKKVLAGFAGGYIPLFPVEHDALNIAEGIETALAARQLYPDHRGGWWTSISLDNFANLIIPAQVKRVTIWGDNDMSDPALKDRIRAAAEGYKAQVPGLMVTIMWPPEGMDFNDYLIECARRQFTPTGPEVGL